MKKMVTIFFAWMLVFSLTACGAKNGATDGAEGWSEDWGITLTVRDVSPTGLTLVCTQSGGIATGRLETGSAYQLWKEDKDGFREELIPQGEAMWDMMAYVIAPDATTEWTVDWSWLYGELGPGTYHISKNIVDFQETGESRSQPYYAKFTIEE